MSTDLLKLPTTLESRVWLALRLGWILAEVYGRLTQPNIRWANLFPHPSKKPVVRLFLSTREPTIGEALWANLQSLVYLVQRLYPLPEDKNGDSQQQFSDPRQPPESVGKLVELAQRVMLTRESYFSIPRTFFNDLNHWSRQIWAVLNAEDPLLAEAATLGAGLADTFWQWRLQRYYPDKEQKWQKLLKPQRMRVMIKRIRQVERHLPDYVGPTLRHSVWEWSKAADDGTLHRLAPPLSAKEKDALVGIKKRKKQINRQLVELPPQASEEKERLQALKVKIDKIEEKLKAEETLKNNFRRQLGIWEDLIFNRPIAYRLRAADWWWVRILSLATYSLMAAIIIVIPALLVYGLISVINNLLSTYMDPILAWLGGLAEFGDQLKLATAAVAVLAFLLTQFRKVAHWVRQLYPSIYNWFLMSALTQRTFYAWDGETKSLLKIWWQRLRLGDN